MKSSLRKAHFSWFEIYLNIKRENNREILLNFVAFSEYLNFMIPESFAGQSWDKVQADLLIDIGKKRIQLLYLFSQQLRLTSDFEIDPQ